MEQPARNAIGTSLRRIRIAKEFSQERLSLACDLVGYSIPRSTIAKIESGIRSVNDLEIFVLSHALKVPVGELFPSGLLRRIRDGTVAQFHRRRSDDL